MKKVLFGVLMSVVFIVTVCVFASCDKKPEAKKIGSYELFEKDGKLGVRDSTGDLILLPEFVEITEKSEYGALFATNEAGETWIMVRKSSIITKVMIDSIVPAGVPDYVYIYGKNHKNYLWRTGSSDVFGPFTAVKLIDGIVFMNKAEVDFDGTLFKNNWGAATINHKGLAPFKYEKVIVVKNDKTMAVLVKDLKSWEMFDQDGVSDGKPYDTPSKVLERRVKKLKLADDIGVINVNWPL